MYTIPQGEHLFLADGTMNPNAILGNFDHNRNIGLVPDDWKKGTYHNGFRQEYTLSVSGGNDRMNYMVSASFLDDQGCNPGVGLQAPHHTCLRRVQGQGLAQNRHQHDPTPTRLPTSPYGQDKDGYSGNASYIANFIGPMCPMYLRDANGNFKHDPTSNRVLYDYGMSGLDGMPFSRTFMSGGNPTGELVYNKEEYLYDVFNGKWFAQITPTQIEGLTPHRVARILARVAALQLHGQQPLRPDGYVRRQRDPADHPQPFDQPPVPRQLRKDIQRCAQH